MEENQSIPLILCMESVNGEEVALKIEPDDDFQKFLDNARALLGYEVDINSITKGQPVVLNDNAYQFLLNAENSLANEQLLANELDPTLDQNENNDLMYILDDGTEINASQIHFDNEDPLIDLTAEKIPFVKYIDDGLDDEVNSLGDEVTKKINIVESPVSRWSSRNSSPRRSFVNSLPFKLVTNNPTGFEAQFTKYVESKTYTTLNPVSSKDKSPRSLITESFNEQTVRKTDDAIAFTREDILNMFKDPPIASMPFSNQNFLEKRRHVRKTDPSRPGLKNWNAKPISYIDVDGTLIAQSENQDCFVCGKFVDNNSEKLYLFDNEDQRLHRSSPQKKMSTQLKIICEKCLNENFKPCRLKSPNQSLAPDEYLVIRNNQQYIFQKTKNFNAKNSLVGEAKAIIDKVESKMLKRPKDMEFVKVEIGSDGEIVTKSIDNDSVSDEVVIIKDEKNGSSSDVEIVEPDFIDDNIIDNLDDADEQVKEFLGKYQCDGNAEKDLKCRFCELLFEDLSQVMDHGEVHKHEIDNSNVYPCPLCDYGYANYKWLKGHLKAAHDRTKDELELHEKGNPESPIAKRTRSNNNKKSSECEKDGTDEPNSGDKKKSTTVGPLNLVIKTEVKRECLDESDDDGIWIVQTADDEPIHSFIKSNDTGINGEYKKAEKCPDCCQIIITPETLDNHKCRKRIKKRMPAYRENAKDNLSNNDDFIRKTKKKKYTETSSDPLIVTCNDCNESFTSKVRLKFHMQFHEETSMRSDDGKYRCCECSNEVFGSEASLFDHIHFQHPKQKRWQCPVQQCQKTFYLRATLTKHSRTHTDTRRYVCVSCGKRFLDKQTLDEHGVTHLQIKPFQCHICMKQLTRRSRLRMHLRAHEEELTARLVLACAFCSQAFADTAHAEEHATKSTKCIEAFANTVKVENEEPAIQLSPTSGIVRHTVQIIESPVRPSNSQCVVSGSRAAPLLSALSPAAASLATVVEIEIAFRCEYCEDVFFSEDGLNTHRQIHKGVKNPFTCHICKVSFATYSRCTTHKTTHGFYKRSLEDAKKLAESSPNKDSHIAKGILGYGGFPVVKHFLCEDCGRSYLHWTYLQVHRRMKHNNDKTSHACISCNLTFPNSWSLAYHKKKVHGNAGQGDANIVTKTMKGDHKIPCRDCEEVLPNKTALYKHRKKEHTDLSLTINNKSVTDQAWSSTGNTMMRGQSNSSQVVTQNGDDQSTWVTNSFRGNKEYLQRPKPYTCSQCGEAFRTASTLSSHLRAHRSAACGGCGTAETRCQRSLASGPYLCPRCPKRFRVRSSLKNHHRLKHFSSLTVIEVEGLNPSKEKIMEYLDANNIAHDKVIDINTISIPKGTTSIVPDSMASLSMLSHLPRTRVWNGTERNIVEELQPAARVAGSNRRPAILQRHAASEQEPAVHRDDLSELNVQLMLRDGLLVNGNPMVQLQLDDTMV